MVLSICDLRGNVLANGCYEFAVCLLLCFNKWVLSTGSSPKLYISKGLLHIGNILATLSSKWVLPICMYLQQWSRTLYYQITVYPRLIFANRCHKLAGTCSNIFVNGCYKPAGFRSNIYLRMVTINLQLWLPVLTHEVYQFAARRRDVSAMIDINLPFIRYFSRGWYQLTGARRHVFANGHWKFAVH